MNYFSFSDGVTNKRAGPPYTASSQYFPSMVSLVFRNEKNQINNSAGPWNKIIQQFVIHILINSMHDQNVNGLKIKLYAGHSFTCIVIHQPSIERIYLRKMFFWKCSPPDSHLHFALLVTNLNCCCQNAMHFISVCIVVVLWGRWCTEGWE